MEEFEKHKKEKPFEVPENYFNDFQEKIQKKIDADATKVATKSKLIVLKPYITIAASFLIIYGFWFLFLSKSNLNSNLVHNNKEIPTTEIDYFLEEIEQEELIEIFSNIDTSFNNNVAHNDEEMADILQDIDESLIIEAI